MRLKESKRECLEGFFPHIRENEKLSTGADGEPADAR
jgi:hypothetical protein